MVLIFLICSPIYPFSGVFDATFVCCKMNLSSSTLILSLMLKLLLGKALVKSTKPPVPL